MAVKLSQVTKLDGIKSWSLPALTTCPGARDANGKLVPVCQGCYAREGNYRFKPVRAVREHNREDWKRPGWVAAMIEALSNERYFRWFDSGDIYCLPLAEKIEAVIIGTPWCMHWIPTRSHKIAKIRPVLERINALPNAVVRYSADGLDGACEDHHGSIVVLSPELAPAKAHVCPAYTRTPATCNGCRACWDKNTPLVAYVAHGRQIKRVALKNSPMADGAIVAA